MQLPSSDLPLLGQIQSKQHRPANSPDRLPHQRVFSSGNIEGGMLVYCLRALGAAPRMELERDYNPDGDDGKRDRGRKVLRKSRGGSGIDLLDVHAKRGLQMELNTF